MKFIIILASLLLVFALLLPVKLIGFGWAFYYIMLFVITQFWVIRLKEWKKESKEVQEKIESDKISIEEYKKNLGKFTD